jgi:prepilin-type processing-associated H-X9-DG protein
MVHYGYHSVAMAHMPLERKTDGYNANGPVKFTQLWPNNALFWDAPLFSLASPTSPAMFWVTRDTTAGLTYPACHIDYDQIADPATPELRFRGPGRDRFSQSQDPHLRPDGPILWFSDEYLISQNGFSPTFNADYGGGTVWTHTINGPRFRHGKNDTSVVAFADGSVRPLRLNKGRFVKTNYYDNEFRRSYIMLKWPNNRKDSNTVITG